MKNHMILSILFALFFGLTGTSCNDTLMGMPNGSGPNTSPNGQWMYINGYAFGVTQPTKFYCYMSVDPSDPNKSLKPIAGDIVVNAWPENYDVFGLVYNSIENNPWPAFRVSFTSDPDALNVLTAMQASWELAYNMGLNEALYCGYVVPHQDATDVPAVVKLSAVPGKWTPIW